ncbi:N-terminal amidohydrolase 1 [Oratosquilla oratoria]|uniref:N-terminal amidohydrolase 1 n=1 Tax=Oratosquilla oratoria TaxID=337810 RepID=UPI003F77738E
MVLIIGEQLVKEVPSSTTGIYTTWPRLKETAHTLSSMMTEEVGHRGLLYLRQREYAVTVPQDENVHILGTDDATTSTVAVLRHTGSGALGLAHFDKCSHEECLSGVHICSHDNGVLNLLTRVNELSMAYTEGRLELCVVGGFQDSRAISEKITLSLLNAFHKSPAQIQLVLLCTGEMNTTIRGNISWPLVKGIGVSMQTGKIFPASFTDKGPYLVLRSTRIFTGAQQMVDIYDCALGVLRIGPFNYEPHAGVELLLQQTDDVILRCLSTTPEVESPTWVKMVREVLKHIKEHPFPAITIFPDNRPHYFRRDNVGAWIPAELPNNNDSTPDANVQNVVQGTGVWTQTGITTPTPTTPAAPAPAPWGSSVPPRYGSLHLDCRLKTHLTVPPMVNTTQHYDDPLLNPTKDRFMPAWQASQL